MAIHLISNFNKVYMQSILMNCFNYRTHLFADKIKWFFNEFLALILTEVTCCRVKQNKKHIDETIRNCSSTCFGLRDENEIDQISNKYKHDYITQLEQLVVYPNEAFQKTEEKAKLSFIMFFRDNNFETHCNFENALKAFDKVTLLCFCQIVYRPDHKAKPSCVSDNVMDNMFRWTKNNMASLFCMCEYFSERKNVHEEMGCIKE